MKAEYAATARDLHCVVEGTDFPGDFKNPALSEASNSFQ